ncbi:MAG: hypothetical protein GY928_23445 [Colwellia sp.]|nr:hypothetical protein [Colwellia sp.]
MPNLGQAVKTEGNEIVVTGSAWHHRHLVLDAKGIFIYVGAEVGIGSFLINFMGLGSIAHMEESEAADYLTYLWDGAMFGRSIGAAVRQKISAGKVLFICASEASLLLVVTNLAFGAIAMRSILLIGLCNSIMFPTIFSIAVTGLKGHAEPTLRYFVVGHRWWCSYSIVPRLFS